MASTEPCHPVAVLTELVSLEALSGEVANLHSLARDIVDIIDNVEAQTRKVCQMTNQLATRLDQLADNMYLLKARIAAEEASKAAVTADVDPQNAKERTVVQKTCKHSFKSGYAPQARGSHYGGECAICKAMVFVPCTQINDPVYK
jgi:hypothetical protein